MNTNLTIKNFRVFDENGVTLELKPITILTGRNSSGKSSVVKAAMFLNAFLCQIKKAIDEGEMIRLENYKVDFTKYPFNLLGNFDKIVHKGGAVKDVTMSYSIYSLRLSKDVNVEFVFHADENDGLKNSYLKSLTLSTEDGVFYSSSRQSGSELNLSMLKNACFEFLIMEHEMYLLNNVENISKSDEKYEVSIKEMEQLNQIHNLFNVNRQKKDEMLNNYSLIVDSIILRCNLRKTFHTLIEWSQKNDSLFNIPILDELDNISKSDFKAFIENEILKDYYIDFPKVNDTALKIASNKIVDDFICSESEKFSEFFRGFENKYSSSNNYCINASDFELKQTYLEDYYDICIEEDPVIRKEKIVKWEKRPISFDMVYEIVMLWNKKLFPESVFYYYQDNSRFTRKWGYVHDMYKLFRTFASDLIIEVVCPEWVGTLEYVSSNISKIKRYYALDESDEFTGMLKKYFDDERELKSWIESWYDFPVCDYKPKDFLNKWVKILELGEKIDFSVDDEGSIVKIYLQKKADGEKMLLADEGYGITQIFSILLKIELAILSYEHYNKQITIAIEEPEIHLHPKYQSLLADMFLEAYQKYNIHFIIETHSEYLIRKLQVLVADKENELSSNEVSLNYVEKDENGVSTNRKIEILEDGRLSEPFGPGFFDESKSLVMQMLKF